MATFYTSKTTSHHHILSIFSVTLNLVFFSIPAETPNFINVSVARDYSKPPTIKAYVLRQS